MIEYHHRTPVIEIPCGEAGCAGCGRVHRRHAGTAEITISGTTAEIREFADAHAELIRRLGESC